MRKFTRAAGTVFAAAALAVCIAPAAGAATPTAAAAPVAAAPTTSVDQPSWYPCYPYRCAPGYYPAPAPPAYYYPAPTYYSPCYPYVCDRRD